MFSSLILKIVHSIMTTGRVIFCESSGRTENERLVGACVFWEPVGSERILRTEEGSIHTLYWLRMPILDKNYKQMNAVASK